MSDSRISVLETHQEITDKRLEKLEAEIPSLIRLNTIMENHNETNKKQNETLEKINDNLTALTMTTRELSLTTREQSERISNIEEKLSNDNQLIPQIENINARLTSLEKRKIDLNKIFHDKFTYIIGLVIVGGMLYVLKEVFGWTFL